MTKGSSIRLGNGVELLESKKYYFDPADVGHDGVHCLSHAHFDHLPRKVLGDEVVASPLTVKCAQDRLNRRLRHKDCPQVKILDSGHILGSSMFLVEDGEKVLYTGDLCTRDRLGMQGAKPVKVDTLILESTFGLPRYIFPPREEAERTVRDWVEDNLSRGRSVGMFVYPLGKSQEMLKLFRDMNPNLYGSSLQTTQLIEDTGVEFSYRPFDLKSSKDPFLLICPTGVRRAGFVEKLRRRGMVTAAISGWAVDSSFKHRMGLDEAFPLSDHSDFNDLLEFAKKCDPTMVLTHHGFERDLAAHIRSDLGIEAYALIKDQRSLLEF